MTDQEKRNLMTRLVLNMQREARLHGEARASVQWSQLHPKIQASMQDAMIIATGDLLQFFDDLIGGFYD